MELFRWSSAALRNYGHGSVLAIAETVEEARQNARETFLAWVRANRDWLFKVETDEINPEDREEYDALIALFETDIAAEPDTGSVFLITGSE